MRHYRNEEWADFARGLVHGERSVAMEQHLSGCDYCKHALLMWKEVAAAGAREANYAPPESAVHIAKSYAAQGAPEAAPSWITQIAELLFDSRMEPALAGVRSSAAATARQMLYASGDYSIDLRIEPQPGSGKSWVVGQILSKSSQSVRNVPITLVTELGPVATTTTNPYGEFHLEAPAALRVELSARLGATHVLIALGDLGAAAPGTGMPGGRGGS